MHVWSGSQVSSIARSHKWVKLYNKAQTFIYCGGPEEPAIIVSRSLWTPVNFNFFLNSETYFSKIHWTRPAVSDAIRCRPGYIIYYKLDKYKEIRRYVSIYFTIRHARHLRSLPVWTSSKNERNSERAIWSSAFIFLSWELTQLKHSVGTRAFTLSSPALPLNLCFKAYIFQNLFTRQKLKSG